MFLVKAQSMDQVVERNQISKSTVFMSMNYTKNLALFQGTTIHEDFVSGSKLQHFQPTELTRDHSFFISSRLLSLIKRSLLPILGP